MMENASIIYGGYIVPWTLTIMILAILSWFFLSYAIYTANGGRRTAMWVFFLPAVFFSVLFSRMIYWYCHSEQYDGLASALTDMSVDGFAMLGVIPGVVLAAALVSALKLAKSFLGMLDGLSTGAGVGMGILYLTALFNAGCRGKVVVSNPEYQHLPFSSPITAAGGVTEYRFATFFFSFIVMFFISGICMEYYFNRKDHKGATSMLFLISFCSAEFVLDSTRYDAGFFRFNGFVSVLQIFAGITFILICLICGILAVKRNGFKWYYLLLWILMLAAEGVTGYLEYLVQRHGDMYVEIYTGMIISSLLTGIFAYLCYRSARKKETVAEAAADEEEAEETGTKSGRRSDDEFFGVAEAAESEDGIKKRQKHGTIVSLILAIAAAVMALATLVTVVISKKGKES